MDIATLDQKNPSYDCDRWLELEALTKGGKLFKKLLLKFLPQNPVEPEDVYAQRRHQAHYRSYLGAIINLYSAWLFAAGFSVKPYERGTETPIGAVHPFYGRFQENVGGETELSAFMQARFTEAQTTHRANWLIEFPSNEGEPPADAQDYENRGLGRASLKCIENHELYDWEQDQDGVLQWAIVHTCFDTRASWQQSRNTTVETWCVYDIEEAYTYQLTYEKGKRPNDPKTIVPLVSRAPHGFLRVPIVRMHIPGEICLAEQVYDTQLEHFRLDNALSWLTRRTCYAQPVFNMEDEERPPTMGAGYAIVIGKDDKMGWTSPPTAPFDVLQRNVDNKREEIYRIVHQMAQAVDNNAETVGRSADSKEIDAAATRIMLNAYGEFVSKAIEETYEIISEARGELNYEWSIEGFSGYDTATVSSLLAIALSARSLGIPSQAFATTLVTKVALAMFPEADQRVKDTIRQEIASASFDVSSYTLEGEKLKFLKSKADLDDAKSAAEPIKANAAMIKARATAKKPAPKLPV